MSSMEWQQARARYPRWQIDLPRGRASVWWNEGASPGWGWNVIAPGGNNIGGGVCAHRSDAERAAIDVGGA